MSKIFKIKPRKNKANGQFNFSIPKKDMPASMKKLLESKGMPAFKFRYEGVDI